MRSSVKIILQAITGKVMKRNGRRVSLKEGGVDVGKVKFDKSADASLQQLAYR